jgi:hypothetical protein
VLARCVQQRAACCVISNLASQLTRAKKTAPASGRQRRQGRKTGIFCLRRVIEKPVKPWRCARCTPAVDAGVDRDPRQKTAVSSASCVSGPNNKRLNQAIGVYRWSVLTGWCCGAATEVGRKIDTFRTCPSACARSAPYNLPAAGPTPRNSSRSSTPPKALHDIRSCAVHHQRRRRKHWQAPQV